MFFSETVLLNSAASPLFGIKLCIAGYNRNTGMVILKQRRDKKKFNNKNNLFLDNKSIYFSTKNVPNKKKLFALH